MITKIFFNGLKKTSEREAFVKEHMEHVLSKFDPYNNVTQNVRVGLENHTSHNGRNLFHCEVQVKGKSIPELILKKSGTNFYQVIAMTADKLSALLSKVHEKQIIKRRKQSKHLSSYFLETAA